MKLEHIPLALSPRQTSLLSDALTYVPRKACIRCGTQLRYTKSRGCLECNKRDGKKYSPRYVTRYRRRNAQWRRDNPQTQRKWQLKHLYGLSWDDYQAILAKQNNCCAICKKLLVKTKDTNVDHQGNLVRGILCGSCNRGIGLLKHSIEIIENAIEYLKRPSCSSIKKN